MYSSVVISGCDKISINSCLLRGTFILFQNFSEFSGRILRGSALSNTSLNCLTVILDASSGVGRYNPPLRDNISLSSVVSFPLRHLVNILWLRGCKSLLKSLTSASLKTSPITGSVKLVDILLGLTDSGGISCDTMLDSGTPP